MLRLCFSPSPPRPGSIPLPRESFGELKNAKSFLEYPVYIFFNLTFATIFIPLSSRSISGTQVLVLIFDSKLSVTERAQKNTAVHKLRLRGRSFLIDRCTLSNVKRDHGHNKSAPMHYYTQGREFVSPILSAEGR